MIDELTSENALLKQTVLSLKAQLKRMQEQLNCFQKMLFGKKSEKFIRNDDQPFLPGFEALLQSHEPSAGKIRIETHEKQKPSKPPINTITFPEDVPVERIELDVSEKEKIDPVTQQPLVCIGEEISRKLAKRPACYFVKEYVRKKYASPGKEEEGIKTTSLPDSIITRCCVDKSVLADVITKQEKQWSI